VVQEVPVGHQGWVASVVQEVRAPQEAQEVQVGLAGLAEEGVWEQVLPNSVSVVQG
jgi:hypothetical protein